MPPFNILKKIRQILSRRGTQVGTTKRTLRLVQLEDRRMLNATFAFNGVATLDLAGFTSDTSQLAVSDTGGAGGSLVFTLDAGTWSAGGGNVVDGGITGAGTATLTVAKSVFEDAGDILALNIDAQVAGASNINLILSSNIVLPNSPTDGLFHTQVDGNATLGFAFDGSGNNLSVDAAGSIAQNAALTNIGTLDYDAGTTINITGQISATGTVDVDSTGLTTIGALGDINAGGAVTFGAVKIGALTTAGDIDTTDDNITFTRSVTLSGNVDFDTTGTAAGSIHFLSTVATGGNNLSLDAGAAGDVTLDGAVTGGGNFVVRDGAVHNYNILTVSSVDILDATTSVTFNGAVNVSANNANGGTDAFKVNTPGLVSINGAITATSAAGLNIDIDPTNINVNANILATGQIDLTASNYIMIAAVTVRADTDGIGGGTLNITADDDTSGAGSLTAVDGSILRGHTANLAGFDITTDVVISDVGNLIFQAANEVTLNDATTATTADVRVTATADDVNLNGLIAAGINARIDAGGAIIDGNGAAVNITAVTATLTAANGIGSGNAIETTVSRINARNTGLNSIEIAETGAIDVERLLQDRDRSITLIAGGTITVLAAGMGGTGVVIDDVLNAGGDADILLRSTAGSVVINQIVRNDSTNPGADITLDAIGQNSDVVVNAAVTAAAGGITIQADDSVRFTAAGDVTATGAGNVLVNANRVNTVGNDSDQILMADGTVINGGTGTVTLTALGTNSGNITLGSVRTANATAAAVVMTTTSGNILDGGDTDVDIVTTNAGSRVTLTATNGSIGASSADVFKGVFNPIDVNLAGGLTAFAPNGAVAISGPVTGTQTITALSLYIESNADLSFTSIPPGFTFTNLALVTTGKLTVADAGLAVTGDLRIQANDVDAVTAGMPVVLSSARLLYSVTNADDEYVSVFTGQLDVRANSNIQVHVNGNTQLRDLNCDLTSFETNGNTAVIVAIGGTITQGTAVGTNPGIELNDRLLSQNLLLLGNGTFCLDHQDNNVNTIAGQLVGNGSLYYHDIDALTVGTVSSLYVVPVPAFAVQAYNGLQTANGDVHVRAGGTLTLNQSVSAGASGNVLLAATGVTSDVILNASISSGTGHITLNAGRNMDLNSAAATAGTGTVFLTAGNNVDVDATITTVDGDILVRATGNISQTALIMTTIGDVGLATTTGNITQTATGNITSTSGDVLIDAGGNWTMANGTVISVGGEDFVGRAGTAITLGQISMTNATANRVALQAVTGSITDINGTLVNIEETLAGAATSVSLRAGGQIGAAGGVIPSVNDNAIDLNVDSVAASASTGIYLREIVAGGAITVDSVSAVTASISVSQVNFKGVPLAVTAVPQSRTLSALEDLRTGPAGGPIKLVAENGTITVNGGVVTPTVGISATGSGDILLEARGAASDVVVNSSVSSGSGHITLTAGDDIDLNAALSTGGAGSIFVTSANGTVDVPDTISIDGTITSGNGDVLIQSPGNIRQTAAIVTANGDVGLVAVGDIVQTAMGDVTTTGGDVLVDAGGNWTMAGDPLVLANNTVISVGGQDFVGRAGNTITLGIISMTNAAANRVALQAVTGNITDANAAMINIEETFNAAATSVSLRAAGVLGAADAANGTPAVNVNAIDLNVDTVAASATTGIYLREITGGGAITVDNVAAVTVNVNAAEQVNFNSTRTLLPPVTRTLAVLEDLTTTNNGSIKLVAENGTITVNGGSTTPTVGVSANGSGDILLEARGAASDAIVNASVSSGTGHITLNAGRNIDLNSTATTVGAGTVYLLAGNNIDVDATITTADGDILVQATGSISQTALITTINGDVGLVTTTGNITQTATGDVTTTDGDALVDAGNNWTMANGTVITVGGQDFVGRANGTILLNQISMTNALANRVALQAVAGNITDVNGSAVNIEETIAAAATSVSLRAGGQIGAADAGNGTPLVNDNAIDLNIDTVAAQAATEIYLREIAAGLDITVDHMNAVTVNVDVSRVNFNSTTTAINANRTLGALDDLTGGSHVKVVVETGTLTVNDGADGDGIGVSAGGSGNILLEARGAASDVVVNANVVGTMGHITLKADDDIDLNANVSTGGSGSIYLLALNETQADAIRGIDMQSGTSITTGGGNVRLVVDNESDIRLSLINAGAGSVSLIAERDILDNNGAALNVQANALRMVADATVTFDALGNEIFSLTGDGVGIIGGPDNTVNALITPVSASATTVTITDGAASNYQVGETIRITEGGNVEERVITAINPDGANPDQIFFATGLSNAYTNAANVVNLSTNINAIDTQVTKLAAQSADGIYVREVDGLTVQETSNILVEQVNFNSTTTIRTDASLSDLSTTDNGAIKLQSVMGSITLNEGDDADNLTVSANGSGDVLIQTMAPDGDIIVNSNNDAAQIVSGTGHITLNAGRNVDLNSTATTAGAGTVYLLAGNNIDVDATITTADGDILVQATGSISQTALITTTNGDVGLVTTTGGINQTATGDVTTTNGDVLVDAGTNWTMANGTVITVGGQDFVGRAGGTITLGTISMTNAAANRVALQSIGGDIADANGALVNIEETVAGAATSVSLRAGGMIGASGGAIPSLNGNAIDLNVDSVAARAATGIYLREVSAGGNLAIENVPAVTVNIDAPQRANFNSTVTAVPQTRTLSALEDLTTTASAAEIQVVVQNGILTVNQGPINASGVAAQGNDSQIHLEASGNVVINADVVAGTAGTTAVDNTLATPGEQIVIRSVSGNIIVGTSNSVTISTDEDLTPGASNVLTSDRIQLLAGSQSPLSSDAAVGQNMITLNSVAGFSAGDVVVVDDGDSAPQIVTITAISGNTLTLNTNLTNNYSVPQNAFVAHQHLGALMFGTSANVTLRTDGGVAHQFAARPQIGVADGNTAFVVLQTTPFNAVINNQALAGLKEYLSVWQFQIGVAGEENLRLDIDWRDPINSNATSNLAAIQAAYGLLTEVNSDRTQVFYISPGITPSRIGHIYTFNDFLPYNSASITSFLIDFSVSQHDSILVSGATVQQGALPAEIVANARISSTDNIGTPTPFPPNPAGINVTNETDANRDFHFEGGLIKMLIPTPAPPIIEPEVAPPTPPTPPVATPAVVIPVLVNAAPVEIAEVPLSSYSTQSQDYFQLREFDGVTRKVVEKYEHIPDEFGELLLQPARLKQWVKGEHLPDQPGLELWLITEKRTINGAVTVERPVLKFDIANGQPFPAKETMPDIFEDLHLSPMPLDDNLNVPETGILKDSGPTIDRPSSETDNQPQDGDGKLPEAEGQSLSIPSIREGDDSESEVEVDVTVSSTMNQSILMSVAVSSVLNQSRVASVAPSKSRQLLNRILNRQP